MGRNGGGIWSSANVVPDVLGVGYWKRCRQGEGVVLVSGSFRNCSVAGRKAGWDTAQVRFVVRRWARREFDRRAGSFVEATS